MFKRLLFLMLLLPAFAYSFQTYANQPDSIQTESTLAKSGHKLLILGDSLSAAYNLKQEQGWVSLLQNAWNDAGISIIDAAISGETTDGGLARLPRLIAQHKPTHLLIELGANDGLRGYPIPKMKNNLLAMIALAKQNNIQVALQEMHIPPNYGRRYTDMFNNAYHQLGEEHQLTVIPFFLQEVALDKSLMQQDGLHPNAQAQPIIARYMKEQLESWIK